MKDKQIKRKELRRQGRAPATKRKELDQYQKSVMTAHNAWVFQQVGRQKKFLSLTSKDHPVLNKSTGEIYNVIQLNDNPSKDSQKSYVVNHVYSDDRENFGPKKKDWKTSPENKAIYKNIIKNNEKNNKKR